MLDGEAERTEFGYDARTESRRLFVPHQLAGDAAEALAICHGSGLSRAKLDAMSAEDAHYIYLTTLPNPLPEN